jgi:hypothetical protein
VGSQMDAGTILEVAKSMLGREEGFGTTVLVGAGASHPAAPDVEALKKGLFKEVSPAIFETHAHVYFGHASAAECTLEELCSVYAKVKRDNENAVYDYLLRKGVPGPHDDATPPYAYELLAHLVKHRLVGCVISANFDELLETSLCDEVGPEGYRWIKSLSEYQAFWSGAGPSDGASCDPAKWTELPVLLKTHGTMSRPMTLRPEVDKVQRFEEQKRRLLEHVLEKTDALLVVGYSFSDPDFSAVMREVSRRARGDGRKLKVCWVSRKRRTQDLLRRSKMFRFLSEQKSTCDVSHFVGTPELFLEALADAVSGASKGKVPSTARLKIRKMVLTPRYQAGGRGPVAGRRLVERSLLIEALIYAVRARGMLGIEAFLDCHRMESTLQRLMKLGDGTTESGPRALFLQLVKDHLLHRCGDSELYYVKESERDLAALAREIFGVFEIRLSQKELDRLAVSLHQLTTDYDIEIRVPPLAVRLLFDNPTLIKSLDELDRRGVSMVEKADKVISVVAQTGEWLTKGASRAAISAFLRRPASLLRLIICEPTVPRGTMHWSRQQLAIDGLREMARDAKAWERIKIREVRWEDLHEHLKFNDAGQGIFMTRNAKSIAISPIWVDNKEDCRRLRLIFDAMWNLGKDKQLPRS